MGINHLRLLRRAAQPLYGRLFGHPQHETDPSQIDLTNSILSASITLLFRRTQVEKDRVAGLGKGGLTACTLKDAPLATAR